MDEEKLLALQAELKDYFDRAAEEKKSYGTMLESTRAAIEGLQKQVDAIDVKLAERQVASPAEPTILEELQQNESVCRLMKNRSGHAVFSLKGANAVNLLERKDTITSAAVGQEISGVLQIDRTPGSRPRRGRS